METRYDQYKSHYFSDQKMDIDTFVVQMGLQRGVIQINFINISFNLMAILLKKRKNMHGLFMEAERKDELR